ncbi:hypothetical protein GCM10010345_19530 [Streptomyces canarius]|uniref:Integrase n=1 Tax=Streptomyces canarius TaxID=285453 RepID=A0ABQ3CMT1_9ACTN|nr:hypothetical protein GCM10010345_19530 [Streptomyces canarius]
MGHRSLQTTQIHCRLTEKRTRSAVDKLVSHQFDRHGNRISAQARRLLEHEHVRLRIGQVSVPYGGASSRPMSKPVATAAPFGSAASASITSAATRRTRRS